MFSKKLCLLVVLSIAIFGNAFSQLWVEMMMDPNANFYDTQAEFNSYWANKTVEKGKGYKQFKRWEEYMEPRVYPSGDVKQATKSRAYENYKQWEDDLAAAGVSRSLNGTWTSIGPVGKPANGGAGRINFIRFDPNNTSIMWVGAPDGGLWKSTNGGTSWTTNTDQLAVIGCTDVAIDPSNTQIMYLATGDGDGSDSYSVGVLKSTNGGVTWNTTGLNWTVNQGRTISRLLINPTNPQIIMAFASNGIHRSTNGGTTWTQVVSGASFKDAEYKPGDPNTVYAAGTTFRRSTDGGATWTTVATGLSGIGRLAIAVTPANANYVYVLASNSADNGFLGLVRSTNSGAAFTTRSSTPNILGWDNGGDAGGQGWYDLAIAVSPTNAELVVTGGVNQWSSTNGGSTWTLQTHWYGGYSKPYVHADIHDIVFLPGSGTTIYSGNDGGVFRSTNTGTAWTDISNNLTIAQQYRIGVSASNANLLIAGHQDNGSNVLNGTTWTNRVGGDGMACLIDRTNNNLMLASIQYGDYRRSTNGGTSFQNIANPAVTGAWVSPIKQDPVSATTFYAAGRPNLYRSTNITAATVTWTQLGSPTGTGSVREFAVAPTNNQIIYAVKSGTNAVSKSTNAGTSFTAISTGLPTGVTPTWIAVSNTNADIVYVSYSGYTATSKVYKSINGGTSWTNISVGLPNLPVNCIVYVNNSPVDAIYVGTDIGVFYTDNTMTGSWVDFSSGLPRCGVRDLEIFYPTGRLRAATFGRGTWESDLYSTVGSPPVANFTSNTTQICPGQTVSFTDLSSPAATSWSWTFTGGTPATSTQQNPTITYNSPGTYTVALTASNANGSSTETKTGYITVSSAANLPFTRGFEGVTFPVAGTTVNDVNGNGTFERTTAASGYGSSTASMIFNNFTLDEAGTRDRMVILPLNFTGFTSISMTFDVAYARYSATYSDSLAVLVSTDCGATYTQVYLKGGVTLSTNGGANVTTQFVPTNAQWRTETINLNTYVGNPNVVIAYENRGRYGNALYIDNINISGMIGSAPVAQFTANNTAVCAGQTVNFTDQSTNSPTSWSWSFPGGTPATSTAQNPTVTYSTPGVYNVTLTATNSNGSNSQTKTDYITVNAVPAANAGSNGPVCTTQSINLTTTAVTGATYSWSGPASFASTQQNPTRPNATTAMSGNYTVTVTANGCSATSSVNVVVNTTPTAVSGSNSPVCSGQNINFTAQTVTGATYAWSGPSSFASTQQNPVRPNAAAAMAGTYTLTVTANGCSATSSTNVTVNTSPNATASSNSPICEGGFINLNAAAVTGATYGWSGPNGFSSTGQAATLTGASSSNAGTYTVTVTANGCSAQANIIVAVNTLPVPTITQSGSLLQATPSSGFTYQWFLDGVPISGANAATFTPTANGNYTVTITDANSCTQTSSGFMFTSSNVENHTLQQGLTVFPNPGNGQFTLKITSEENVVAEATVYNALGAVVLRKPLNVSTGETMHDLNLLEYASGVYFVKVSLAQSEHTIRIIKW